MAAADMARQLNISSRMVRTSLAPAPIYAAGNGDNDLEMLRLARLSFAPLLSPEQVRAAADRLIDVRKVGLLMPMLEEIGIPAHACQPPSN
jgi:hydroxymethylpyrimidine pyrophosphatase-like HAD family hydrolase